MGTASVEKARAGAEVWDQFGEVGCGAGAEAPGAVGWDGDRVGGWRGRPAWGWRREGGRRLRWRAGGAGGGLDGSGDEGSAGWVNCDRSDDGGEAGVGWVGGRQAAEAAVWSMSVGRGDAGGEGVADSGERGEREERGGECAVDPGCAVGSGSGEGLRAGREDSAAWTAPSRRAGGGGGPGRW